VKRVCTVCHRLSADGNLWCQEPDCPAGHLPIVFDYGEWLGDIQVLRLLRILRNAAIYEAERDGQKVLLKVAHDGYQDQLRLEARTLAELAADRQHPSLPVLLPAYRQAEIVHRPYGKTVFQGETKYYLVFEHIEGEFMRDMLLKNPQPWYLHAAWLAIMLADVVAFLHIKARRLHLNLHPEAIYIRYDKAGVPRPVLLDLGLLSAVNEEVRETWMEKYAVPAYTPPELIARDASPSQASDVYSLGLLLYEMLAGRPAFEFAQRRDADVRAAVVKGVPQPLERTDLAKDIHEIVQQAIHRQPAYRQQDVRVFAKMLRTKFGEVPPEKTRNLNRHLAALVVGGAFMVTLWIMLAALLG